MWFKPIILLVFLLNVFASSLQHKFFLKFSDSYMYAKHERTMADFSTRAWTSSVKDGITLQSVAILSNNEKKSLSLYFMSHSTLESFFITVAFSNWQYFSKMIYIVA